MVLDTVLDPIRARTRDCVNRLAPVQLSRAGPQVANQMAAPAEPRTPKQHRAKRIAPRECVWKHGDRGRQNTSSMKNDHRLDSDRHGRRFHQRQLSIRPRRF